MRTITTRCSLVIRLSDGFTGRPPASSAVSLSVEGSARKPIVKSDGMWIFTDLEGAEVTVIIESAVYRRQKARIRLDELSPLEPVVAIALVPGGAYPLPSGTTILDAAVTDRSGAPLAGERVEAEVALAQASRGRLVADASSGSREIEVLKNGAIGVGDYLRLSGRDNTSGQVVRILEHRDGVRKYALELPLAMEANRGDQLLPHLKQSTDERGRIWMAFRQPMPSAPFEIFLNFPDLESQTPISITLNASVLNQADIRLEV
ncbi:hypothetical protein [Paenibacillus methanolicus]|uniref:Carboxypeptidase family protein n=1 Tax=Paenibacillus methanolicus TaxID=582686 RepID=A0A5S5CLD8_9BACL|nr:hypothetical protein [Paenibacillus methanolicus]TYP79677.1 hypothetical protein BCM02_101798 [Paenibacillus methanolicus]